ncbi:hypothetical protein MMYC01_209149 [Madurella mycetomatis]|uniref:Uncharacterized protein n=1 Tax=Madurella mycetomatis TaxID=100816 RepID=A0A175VSF8_9PEZI|nr:hypothetical protein MMYC01_209149 [Madurella mycetomatis]
MSSRLPVPVSKFTRSLSTTQSIGRPSQLLSNASKAASGAGRKRQSPVVADEPAADHPRHHSTTPTTTTTPHRPVTRSARTIPFMQTFHHSAPKPSPAVAGATAEAVVLPNLFMLDAADQSHYDPYAHIRVPLLPDNVSPPAWFRQPEVPDAPLPRPEIVVVAPDPARDLPAALTEVEGMGVDGVELKFAHELGRENEAAESFEMGQGMIRDLWRGMVEDVFGPPSSSSGSSGKGPAAAA